MFACDHGFTLDPSIGALYLCSDGVWSAKPRCLSRNYFHLDLPDCSSFTGTDRCSLSFLKSFVSATVGVQSTNQTQLIEASDDSNIALNGSYVVFSCMDGYTNVGGSLNVTCDPTGEWSPLPKCVRKSDALNSMTTAAMSHTGARCSVAPISFFVPYASLINTTGLRLYEDNTVSGMFIGQTLLL